jgi:hypothetical protein
MYTISCIDYAINVQKFIYSLPVFFVPGLAISWIWKVVPRLAREFSGALHPRTVRTTFVITMFGVPTLFGKLFYVALL